MILVSSLLGACLGRSSAAIPFDLAPNVEETLASWRSADIKCGEPEIGMPGPAADWHCEVTSGDIEVTVRLIADANGVQSIHVGVPKTTDRAAAAHAFVAVVEATASLTAARSEITAWLLANDAADGTMPPASPAHIGRAAVDSTEPRSIILYLIPLDSTIMSGSALAHSVG